MKAVADFVPLVAAEVPGAADPSIEDAVRRAAIQFCTEAYVWVDAGFAQDIRAGVSEYFVTAPRDGQIQAVLGVFVSGKQIATLPGDEYPYGTEASGTPHTAFLTDLDRLALYPTPDADIPAGLIVRVAAVPKPNAKQLPDLLWNRHQDGIKHGALAILKAQVGQEWGDPGSVDFHHRMMRREISRAKADRIRGRSTGRVSVRRRRFC